MSSEDPSNDPKSTVSTDARYSRGNQIGGRYSLQLNVFEASNDDSHPTRQLIQRTSIPHGGDDAFTATEALRAMLEEGTTWPIVREWDPLDLGLHRAGLAYGNAVPPYIRRDQDEKVAFSLRQSAERGGMTLIVGDSTAGKTRSAYEGLLSTAPNRRLFAPTSLTELTSTIPSLIHLGQQSVLWLDDLENYVDPNGLTPRILTILRNAGVMIVATIRTEEYRRLTDIGSVTHSVDRVHRQQSSSNSRMLEQAEVVVLQRRWTPEEIERARTSEDVRIAAALDHHATYGIAEYIAAGPQLYRHWELSWETGANPRGAAIVEAALDCSRAGFVGSLPKALLESAHVDYLERAGGEVLRPEPFTAAMGWATRRHYGVSSLLLPGRTPDSFRLFDYILDTSLRQKQPTPVLDITWNRVLAYVGDDRSLIRKVSFAARNEGRIDVALRSWEKLANSGDGEALHRRGHLLIQSGDIEDAIKSWTKAAEAGEEHSPFDLGIFFQSAHRFGEARRWLEVAAEAGDESAMGELARVLKRMGQHKEAERWAAKATEESTKKVSKPTLAYTLAIANRLEQAESVLRGPVEAGDSQALNAYGIILRQQKRTGEAEEAFRKAVDSGNIAAMANLGQILRNTGHAVEAEDYFRRSIQAGWSDAYLDLADHLVSQGRVDEAVAEIGGTAQEGLAFAAYSLGSALVMAEKPKDAEPWLRQAASVGIYDAKRLLAQVLSDTHRNEEALPFWQDCADQGDPTANFMLGEWHAGLDDWPSALPAYISAAQGGDEYAACKLGMYFWSRDPEQAHEWLQIGLELGHSHSACVLAEMYETLGVPAEAERLWKLSISMGHGESHVAVFLASLLAKQEGRGKEAAFWLHRAKGALGNSKAGSTKKRPQKRSQRRGGKGRRG